METKIEVKTHFCAGVLFRGTFELCDPERRWDLLVLNYNQGGHTDKKFPGGCNKINPQETPEQTLVREFKEETGFQQFNKETGLWEFNKETGLQLTSWILIHRVDKNPFHTQYFYLITGVGGKLRRDEVLMEDSGEILGQPTFSDPLSLKKEIFYSHEEALEKALTYAEGVGIPVHLSPEELEDGSHRWHGLGEDKTTPVYEEV